MPKHVHNWKYSKLEPIDKYYKLSKYSCENDSWQFESIDLCDCGKARKRACTKEEFLNEISASICPYCKVFGNIHSSPGVCLPSALDRLDSLEQSFNSLKDEFKDLVERIRNI